MATKQGMRVRVSDVTARERLLKSATELFTRKGYSGTTVREIVAAAGVTKPVLYYYFRNKEGIYLELMRGGFSRFDSLLEESLSVRGSAADRLTRLCTQVFSLFLDHIDVARVMYAIYYGPPQGAPFIDFDAYHRNLQDVVRGLVREKGPAGKRCSGERGQEMKRALASAGALLIMGAGLSGCSADGQNSGKGATPAGRPPVAVEATRAALADITAGIDVVGNLSSKYDASVKSEFGGTVADVYVTEWVRVQRGAPLARVDTREAEAVLKKAQASLEM